MLTFCDNFFLSPIAPPPEYVSDSAYILCMKPVLSEAVPSTDSGRVVHVLWRTIIWPLDVSRELLMDGQSFSRHTVSGSLAVH